MQPQSLPPILHMNYPISMWSYSKGSRGLFVPLRVIGIFTDTTISPSSWLRQYPDHYTIRAGRNLPDKEFRYLRTVIVTAAVYWGFNSKLRSYPLTSPLNLPAPGRCQTLYFILLFMQSPVFLLNSRLGLFTASYSHRNPFSRSYRVNLPSSLTMDHSSALGYSPRLPVSVYGTGCLKLQRLEAFLGNKFTNTIYSSKPKQYYQVSAQGTDLPIPLITYTLQRTIPSVRGCFTIPSLHHYLKQVSEY